MVFNRSATRDVCVCNVKPVEEEERAEETQKKQTQKKTLAKENTRGVHLCGSSAVLSVTLRQRSERSHQLEI